MSVPTIERSIPVGGAGPQPSPGRDRRFLVVAVLAILAVVAALLVVVLLGDDGDVDQGTVAPTTAVEPGAVATTLPASTAPAVTDPVEVVDPTVLWPFPGSSTRFDAPDDAARSFATEYLGFVTPVVEPFQAGDARSGEVPVRPTETGPVTTVLVRQVGAGDDWSVLGAVSEHITVDEPTVLAEVASPVRVTGRALAFEGTVQVEVRADGGLGALGEGFVTGGGDVARPFEGSIPFETPGAPHGALVLSTASGEDGRTWQATTVRVSFRSTDIDAAACDGFRAPRYRPGPDQMEVKLYASCGAADDALRPVYRLVPRSPRVLQSALQSLLAGLEPAELDASLSTWFSADTEGMLRSVVVESGHAVVDFADIRSVIPNASTSAGSAQLLAVLDATVFQFRSVESVEYRIEGSCEAFTEWLQFGGCEPRTRPASAD